MKKLFLFGSGILVAAAIVSLYMLGLHHGHTGKGLAITKEAIAAQSENKASPVEARPRETYYPNSETLAPDEMRVIACGTGMPTTRAAQAAACFLVELGNGDKFLFDIGSGSAERISSLQIPYNYLDKVLSGICTPTTSVHCTISSLVVR